MTTTRFGNVNEGETEDFQGKARRLVAEHQGCPVEEVYVVWFCKTLQNWKALLSTMAPNDLYYEVTYSGDKAAAYVDVYRKVENVVVPDGETR
jgi:hypothetical protein